LGDREALPCRVSLRFLTLQPRLRRARKVRNANAVLSRHCSVEQTTASGRLAQNISVKSHRLHYVRNVQSDRGNLFNRRFHTPRVYLSHLNLLCGRHTVKTAELWQTPSTLACSVSGWFGRTWLGRSRKLQRTWRRWLTGNERCGTRTLYRLSNRRPIWSEQVSTCNS